MILTHCPECLVTFQVPSHLIGRKAACKRCNKIFVIKSPSQVTSDRVGEFGEQIPDEVLNPRQAQSLQIVDQKAVTDANGLGIAGFVISLVGFLTVGILSPIGLVFSAIAMRRKPKGLAIAGLVLGIIGSIFLGIIGLGFFSAFLIPVYTGSSDRARLEIARSAIGYNGPLSQAIDLFKVNTGEYPTELIDLVQRPMDKKITNRWRGPYLIDMGGLRDPWDHDYQYDAEGKKNVGGIDLWSMGPDGIDGNDDDIVNWK